MSNISKNIESLEVYNNYKVFLDQLSTNHASKEEKDKMDQDAELKKSKKMAKDKSRKYNFDLWLLW